MHATLWILTAACLTGALTEGGQRVVFASEIPAFVLADQEADVADDSVTEMPSHRDAGLSSITDADPLGKFLSLGAADDLSTSLFPNSYPETLYDALQETKQRYHLPISAEAWHWQHQNNGGPNKSGYGIPGIRGTYYWALKADPELTLNPDGFFTKIGAHAELRLREQQKFRSFFTTRTWFWELYGWVDTPVGRFKGGKIWRRFGLDWDGSFWGNVPYYDGFKLNPDLGLAWEKTWTFADDFKVDSFAQFFVHEDGINGSIAGADSESVVGSSQRNTGIVRLIPTWTFSDQSTLALGLSGMAGEIVNNPIHVSVPHQVLGAWAIDLTYSTARWKVFGEVLQAYGVRNPKRFTSGGPSDLTTDVLVGMHYRVGPVTYRVSYSAGFDEHPSGWQQLWVPGATVALTKNIDFYAEWSRWDVYRTSGPASVNSHRVFQDGFNFVINWRY